MIQANTVLETKIKPQMETIDLLRNAESVLPEGELELFIDEEDDRDDFLDVQPDEDDSKSVKGAKARRREARKSTIQKTLFGFTCKKSVGFDCCELMKKLNSRVRLPICWNWSESESNC